MDFERASRHYNFTTFVTMVDLGHGYQSRVNVMLIFIRTTKLAANIEYNTIFIQIIQIDWGSLVAVLWEGIAVPL
jgi:hypothetical protein